MQKEKNALVLNEFDWDLYSDGYNGSNLSVNKKIKTDGKGKTKVYSHENYAQDLFDAYISKNKTYTPKDEIVNTIMGVVNIRKDGETSIVVDTIGGGSCKIDLNKEKEYIRTFGHSTVESFVESLSDEQYKDSLLQTHPVIKVLGAGRVSLWSGHLANIEKEFMEQIKNPTSAYYAKVLETNKGGYIVETNGIRCFMPGSMAAAGVISDFSSLIGKVIPVMVVNYMENAGFVVSFKKYLTTVLPHKVETELSVNQRVVCKVTGISKNGVFVQFDDKDKEPIFTGLIHRDHMSFGFENQFDRRNIMNGEVMNAYIHTIDVDGDRVRIVLGDCSIDSKEYNMKLSRLNQQKDEHKK